FQPTNYSLMSTKRENPSFLLLLAAFIVAMGLNSCTEDIISSSQDDDFPVNVKNGYLEFKDQEAFDQIKSSLKGGDRDKYDAWESQFPGFTSLRSTYERSIDEQERWYDYLESLSNEELKVIMEGSDDFFYSDFIKNNSKLFVLYDSGMYDLNLPKTVHELIPFVNNDGLIKIGSSLYKYNENSIKIVKDGKDEKLKLLENIQESSEEYNIEVINIYEVLSNSFESSGARQEVFGGNGTYTCDNQSGSDKVNGFLYVATYVGLDYFYYSVDAKAESWRRNGIFGGWTKKRTGALKIEGNPTISYRDYPAGVIRSTTVNVDHGSGGSLVTEINKNIFYSPSYYFGSFITYNPAWAHLFFDGLMTYRGRSGSNCTM
ncbi:MAG: hypothetical protein AAF992_15695, partial [Bacteroidota bacterium]